MRRAVRAVAAAAFASLALAAPAAAHIDIQPATVTQGQATEFEVRVPTERPLATTAVRIDFPDAITVYSFAQPPPGWSMKPRLSSDGTYEGVDYTGGSSGVDRYVTFRFLGTGFTAGQAIFPTRQTYADDAVKPWTGPPEQPGEASAESGPTDPGPAPSVSVVAQGTPAGPAAAASSSSDDDSGAAIWLGVIAIAIAALAGVGVGLLWSTRPARLPPDADDER
ncbi:MAG: DUF1775 domain-containing protein [Thermoleophilia bacterium]